MFRSSSFGFVRLGRHRFNRRGRLGQFPPLQLFGIGEFVEVAKAETEVPA